jgi:hypothetical protein
VLPCAALRVLITRAGLVRLARLEEDGEDPTRIVPGGRELQRAVSAGEGGQRGQ